MELYFRDNTIDREIWEEVAHQNCYRLPEAFTEEDTILDIGAHIGSFAYACLRRGAGKVQCFEPSWDSCKSLIHNLHSVHGWQERCDIHHLAVWRADANPGYFHLGAYPAFDDGRLNTGGCAIGEGMQTVGVISVTDIIRQPIRLMKLDCEGAEWPILFSIPSFKNIEEIVGEYHERPHFSGSASYWPPFEGKELGAFLTRKGFKVTIEPTQGTALGKFFAVK